MKHIVFLIFLLISISCFAQENRDSLLHPTNSDVATDSFNFCSKVFKIPRKCNDASLKNCCVFYSFQNQLVCGVDPMQSMFWSYPPTLEIAQQVFEGMVTTMESTQKNFSKREIDCYLLGTKVNSLYIETEAYSGTKEYLIISYGIVNNKIVISQYFLNSPINQNPDITPVFRQIILWK